MRLSRLLLFLLISSAFSNLLLAQYEEIEEGYYTFPIQPDKVNFLSGTMGELRATHFHAGLDIKTNGKEGLNVYAAADGYISRVRVSTGGYGNSIYIQHPNGTTTVYAHLRQFNESLAEFVLKNQYDKESFEVNLFPQRNQFTVKKGQVIGLSGNSGSSSGPHLHFEIRNRKQEVLDPLRVGFEQIRDGISPIPLRVALKTMDINSRINGQFGRFEFELLRKGNEFVIPDTIQALGKIGVEIWAHDKLDGAANRNGIPLVSMFQNRERVFEQDIDTVNFSDQKNILVHTNYRAQKQTRRRYNKLYVDDGNSLDFYDRLENRGFLRINEDSLNRIAIRLTDSYNNVRMIRFNLLGTELQEKITSSVNNSKEYDILDNTLLFFRTAEDSELENITLYSKGQSRVMGPTYSSSDTHVYLWDLRKGLPDSVTFNYEAIELALKGIITSSKEHSYIGDSYALHFDANSLFDTLYLQTDHYTDVDMEILEVNEDIQPIKRGFSVELKPLLKYDSLEAYHVYQINNIERPSFIGGRWEDGTIRFSIGQFGKFTLLRDSAPPEIQILSRNDQRLNLSIKDEMSGIKEFRAELNGKWLLMKYDAKKNRLWADAEGPIETLKGDFSLKVLDNAGNESILSLKL